VFIYCLEFWRDMFSDVLNKFLNRRAAKSYTRTAYASRPAYSGRRGVVHRASKDLVSYYRTNPVVYRCVSYIATSAASIKLQVAKDALSKGGAEELQMLIMQPNSQQTQSEFLEQAISDYLLTGNAYIVAVFDGDWRPKELRVLRSENVEVIKGEYGCPKGYVHHIDDKRIEIPYARSIEDDRQVQEVLHIKAYNPTDDFVGYSPVAAALGPIRHMQGFDAYNAKVMDNAWRPSGVFYYTGSLPLRNEERAKLERDLSELIESGDRPVLLENLKWEPLPHPPAPSYDECTTNPAKRVAQAFGVPPSLIGIIEPKFSNYREARKQFWDDTVNPLASKFERGLSAWLSNMFGGAWIERAEDCTPEL
jgi:HK97 family phage portal protein